jgi:MutS domain V
VTIPEVLVQYEERSRQLHAGIEHLRLPHALAAAVMTLAFGVFLALSLYAIRGQVSFLWPSLPITVAAASARRLRRNRQSRYRMWRLTRFYDRALQRVKGNWVGSETTGESFSDADHVYSRDLMIFGEGSLFELLCIARTSIGQRGLANYLVETPALEEILLRQEAVRELRERVDLREKIATLGEFASAESKWDTFEHWLNSPTLAFPRYLPLVTAITSGLLAGLVLAGFSAAIPWARVAVAIGALTVFHAAVGLFFRKRVKGMIDWVRPVWLETLVLREGLDLLAKQHFQSIKLRRLVDQVQNSSAAIRKLDRLLDALAQRDKEWFYHFSRLLLAGTQLCIAIEQWRAEHGVALKIWLESWAEFEALNAMAAYGYENPENAFPEFSSDDTCFEARELGHPLLPYTSCVVNDVELGRASRFYVISGSNMSGKSTLLRSIGLNAVLAFAGAPVRARALRLSDLSIFASLSIVDSLLNGKSKFLAELDRLRLAIEATAEKKPVLFLVDEIFSGTNSRDRRIAAEAVVRTLIGRGAIGVLSTHDLALTEIAKAEGMRGANLHMGSKDGRDPMDFDYRLRPGVTTEANALAIARMAGVPV